MCYYNGIKVTRDEYIRLKAMEKRFALEFQKKVQSGFSYQHWPILVPTADGESFNIELAHWELIPDFVKAENELSDFRKKYTNFNAMGETLLDSRMWKAAAQSGRCLVLSSGFYEFRHVVPPGKKTAEAYPYYIYSPGKNYFFMAGLQKDWTDQNTGKTVKTFSIVTTAANELMTRIHNKKKRMPVILPEDLAVEWINPQLTEDRIRQLAVYKEEDNLDAFSIRKDFLSIDNPEEKKNYPELTNQLFEF